MRALSQLDLPLGLSEIQVADIRSKMGRNVISAHQRGHLSFLRDTIKEPMFILLIISCSLYFILGELQEGVMMFIAIGIVVAISIYQETRSANALKALQQYTEPCVVVRREGVEKQILSEELVPGDIILLQEGGKVPADAVVIQSNDLSVDESIITGESMPVEKFPVPDRNHLYHGTFINSGKCYAQVTAIGDHTQLGKLEISVSSLSASLTPLQKQINVFVKSLAIFGFVGFLVVWLINYMNSNMLGESLLMGLTIAMSAIPEEIPVAFASFMALGSYYMAKRGLICRQPTTIENIGAVSVMCFDKTGTITKNQMEVKAIYTFSNDSLEVSAPRSDVLEIAFMASETNPFDAMEKAIASAYQGMQMKRYLPDGLTMIHEYPLEGKPPMMTHVYKMKEQIIVTSKGALERILKVCRLSDEDVRHVNERADSLAAQGYRMLGVASAACEQKYFPESQDMFNWKFEGFLALYDPPRENISDVLNAFYKAGVKVKLLTGDYSNTSLSIARQINMRDLEKVVTGDDVMKMKEAELQQTVRDVSIFTRMFPEAKLNVIKALQANGEITAMTGDGVNDGLALMAADVGIAMGRRGTELARQAASLILTDDDPAKIVEAIQYGRKIHLNLIKATHYIVSVHIPIILIVAVPLVLGWEYVNIFTPIHVIFLELIMGPTCSIFYEREMEHGNLMHQSPRNVNVNMFGIGEMTMSILQGMAITVGLLALHYFFLQHNYDLAYIRTLVFTTLIVSNFLLTFVNRSLTETVFKTLRYKNNLSKVVVLASVTFLLLIHFVPFVQQLFGLTTISLLHFFLCLVIAISTVCWVEVYKYFRFKGNDRTKPSGAYSAR